MISTSLNVSHKNISMESVRAEKRPRPEHTANADSLHVIGYKVYKAVIKVTQEMLDESVEKSKNEAVIFNHNESHRRNDFKRRQYTLNASQRSKKMNEFLGSIDRFISDNVTNILKPAPWVVIHSRPGCQDQAAHCDYAPDVSLATAPDEQMPLSALVPLMPGTRLNIWPNSVKLAFLNQDLIERVKQIPCEELSLGVGDLLIFRGDFIHAGSSYENDNYRLHTFLDSNVVARHPNETWIVHKHGPEALRNVILPKANSSVSELLIS